MAFKGLKQVNGVLTEQEFSTSSTGATDAGKPVALNSAGKIDESTLPTGIGAETISVAASEALSAGDFVNLYADSGAKCRKADASTSGKEARGFVLAAVESAATATVYLLGQVNSQRTGMTPGSKEYLSTTTAGSTQETVPSTSGQVIQLLGTAASATELPFAPAMPIVLA
jgi:hypothetical protein